ncbi:MAG: hypothetical protein E5V89_27735, partial [Mesorhizobium sp.]
MEYLIKSALAATEIAPSSGPSGERFSAGEKAPMAALAPSLAHRAEAGSRGAPDEGAALAPAFVILAESAADMQAREALLD